MKEVLTKRFWRGVTKTFYEALEGTPRKGSASHASTEVKPQESRAAEARPSPEVEASSADAGARSKAP